MDNNRFWVKEIPPPPRLPGAHGLPAPPWKIQPTPLVRVHNHKPTLQEISYIICALDTHTLTSYTAHAHESAYADCACALNSPDVELRMRTSHLMLCCACAQVTWCYAAHAHKSPDVVLRMRITHLMLSLVMNSCRRRQTGQSPPPLSCLKPLGNIFHATTKSL